MPASLDRYFTREEVLAFPDDGKRYELVYGELLVSPSPALPHQRVLRRLLLALEPYVARHRLGETLTSPADITWGRGDDILVQPDLFVTGAAHLGATRWDSLTDFLLFVEILSPSTARYDRFTKRRLYQEMRVPLYWLLDLEKRRAEIWTPEGTSPTYEARLLSWHPAGTTDAFTLELAELFAP
ncbi:MAG: Uma2 family endonuclease [Gemmatimonadota bacterium]